VHAGSVLPVRMDAVVPDDVAGTWNRIGGLVGKGLATAGPFLRLQPALVPFKGLG
jgi:hypothetical protein